MSYDLMFQQALALHEQGRFDEAENLYRQILQTAPDNPDVLNLLGLVAQAKGVHNEAVELFYQAIRKAPTHAPFYFNLALSLDMWGKPFEAIDAYQKALSLKPDIKEAWNNIGNIYKSLKDNTNAASAYKKAIELDANYIEPQANLANLNHNIEELRNISRKYPEDALSFYFLANAFYLQQDYKQAEENITKAEQNAQTDADIKNLYGLILLAQKRPQEAKSYFQKAFVLNPQNVSALINLANQETADLEYEQAEKHYKRALELSPQDLDAHINYADFLYRQNRLPEALEEYRSAVIINPAQPEISNNLGIILKDLGEYEEALGLFFNAFNQAPQKEEISINIAETLTLLYTKDEETAKKIVQNWYKLAPDNTFAIHTKAALTGEKDLENTQIYAEKLFDNFADNYELVLQKLNYGVVRSLRDFTGNVQGRLVDLGCGTGLAGVVYKAPSTELVGVDISEKMLQRAQEKGIYQKLIKSDILTYLQNKPKADLFIATDVFNYIGELSAIFKAVFPQKLAFSTENLQSEEGYALQPNGRFAHTPQYIKECLEKAGYKDIKSQETTLRTENNQPVKGTLWKTW